MFFGLPKASQPMIRGMSFQARSIQELVKPMST